MFTSLSLKSTRNQNLRGRARMHAQSSSPANRCRECFCLEKVHLSRMLMHPWVALQCNHDMAIDPRPDTMQ